MSKKMMNSTFIQGYLYEHKLELRETGPNSKKPGTQYIRGSIDIATDDACTNIVPVYFSYVTATTSKGTANSTFTTLLDIVDGRYASVMTDGKDKAVKLKIDSAIGLNDFYTNRNGKEELVSSKRNEGGFVHVVNAFEGDRNKFKCDMLITGVREIEPNEEQNIPAKVIVRGAIFDFRNALLPVEFSATSQGAMSYFLSLDASNSNPTFTNVWGNQVSETIVRKMVTESAFGDDEVREIKNNRKDWVLTGASREPYIWDDETTLTAKEVAEAVAAREVYLATIKQRQEENKNAAAPVPAKSNGGFDF